MTMLILMLDKDEENGQEEADEIIIKKHIRNSFGLHNLTRIQNLPLFKDFFINLIEHFYGGINAI